MTAPADRERLTASGAVRVRPTRSTTALRPGQEGVRGHLRALLRRAAGAAARSGDEAWDSALVRLFGRSRTTVGNAMSVYGDGDAWYAELTRVIDAARVEVWIESYIVRDDATGRRVRDRLIAAAARGVSVVLLVDGVGSAGIGSEFLEPALGVGVRVGVFNSPWRWWRHGPFRRNHRKVAVIDGAVAFVGGMNIGDEYSVARSGAAAFDDLHLQIAGPAAAMLRARTARLIVPAGLAVSDPLPAKREDPDRAAAVIQVLETDGAAGRREIQAAMRVVLAGARHSIDIVTPYFVPPGSVIDAMIAARHRGVVVRMLTAGRSDVPLTTFAARHVYGRLLAGGIEIRELHDRTLHAKLLVVDRQYALVGSFNLDQWSHRRNLELNVGFVDASTVGTLSAWIDERIDRSERVDIATHRSWPWWRRAVHAAAWRIMQI